MITFQDICKVYHIGGEEVRALDHANLQIDKGEFVSVIAIWRWKSTLMKHHRLSGCSEIAASIFWDGQPIEQYSRAGTGPYPQITKSALYSRASTCSQR